MSRTDGSLSDALGRIFPDALNAQIVAARLTDHAEVFDLLNAKSYRIHKP